MMIKVDPTLVLVRCSDRTFDEATSRFNGHCGEMMFDALDQAARHARQQDGRAFAMEIHGDRLGLRALHA